MSYIPEILISVLLAYIAWQNFKINQANSDIQKDNLRLDLFERRLKTFEACRDLFYFVVREGKATYEELNKFSTNSANSEFLFSDDVILYIKEIREKTLELIQTEKHLSNSNLSTDDRGELARKYGDIEIWFSEQLNQSKGIFKKYIHFSTSSPLKLKWFQHHTTRPAK